MIFSPLLPAEGRVFGKEGRMWGVTAMDGVEEKTVIAWMRPVIPEQRALARI